MRFANSLHCFVIRSGLVMAIGMVMAGSAAASDWYVDVNAPAGGNGSQANPFQKIGDALTASSDGDRILVSPGTYPELLTVQKTVTILGQLGATTTISDLRVSAPALTIWSGKSVWLQDLTITSTTGVFSRYQGGGINNSGTTVAVRCHITGCITNGGGGGVYNSGTMVMWGCVVDQCISYTGEGGGIDNRGTLKMFSCSVTDNDSLGPYGAVGGGIYSDSYPISPDVSVLRLVNVTICGNSAGAGSYSTGGNALGGGVFAYGSVWIDHSTISNNAAYAFNYVGYVGFGAGYYGPEADVTHSIFADNIASDDTSDFDGVCNSHGYLLIRDTSYTTIVGDMTGVQTGVDPVLLPPADNGGLVPTEALDPTSPCIDTGNPDPLASPAYDARGFPRALWDPAVGPSDLGAYEYASTPSFLLTATPDLPLPAGAIVALTTGGGVGLHPSVLTLVEVNGSPMFIPVVVFTFDQSGIFLLEATVPAGLSGLTAGFRTYSLDSNDKLEATNEALLTFQ